MAGFVRRGRDGPSAFQAGAGIRFGEGGILGLGAL